MAERAETPRTSPVTPIQTHMIRGADRYHQYLKDQNKGRKECRVVSIETIEEETYELKLDKKLLDTDSLLFELFGETFKQTQISILDYDSENYHMVIRPNKQSEKCIELMRKVSAKDILLVADLRFLVRRVKEWYEEYGQRLRFPAEAGTYATAPKPIENQKPPSDEQKEAIESALNSPVSYIWGAPGTGKTQYVLGYCVYHYIQAKQRIAIFAPTNNSIDQVMRGVIRLLKQAGIEYGDKILRLGTPTKQFAEEFPEICEFQGIAKQIERYKQQVETLKEVLKYKIISNQMEKIKNTYHAMTQMSEAINQRASVAWQLSVVERGIRDLEKALPYERAKFEGKQEVARLVESRMQGSLYRFYSALRSGDTGRAAQLRAIRNEISQLSISIEGMESKMEIQRSGLAALQRELSECPDPSDFLSIIMQQSNDVKSLYEITQKLNTMNLENSIRKIKELLDTSNTWYQSRLGRYAEYDNRTADEIQSQILQMNSKIEELRNRTTAERSKRAIVIAGTLDAYVSRISHNGEKAILDSETDVSFAHVFLDEAGYANLPKGTTLFACHCPITFLGDHYQLPPVCEMDLDDEVDARYPDAWLWSETSLKVESLFFRPIEDLKRSCLEGHPPEFSRMPKRDLHETFRFGKELASLLDQHVYDNCGFRSAPGVDSFRIEYIDAPRRTISEKKRENLDEALAVRAYVHQHAVGDVAVLTPYRNQLHLLEKRCEDFKRKERILTVHGSQGREWDTVILSVSDTSDMYFTNTRNRGSKGRLLINTAVSRAKKRLILVCDYTYWISQDSQMICALLKNARPVKMR